MHRDTELHLAVKPYKISVAARRVGGAAGNPWLNPRARAGGDPLGAAPCLTSASES